MIRRLQRTALVRWFKGSLPGRISAVFLLAAVVTVVGLVYASQRLEDSLLAPRERSVTATRELSVAIVKQVSSDTPTSSLFDYPLWLDSVLWNNRFSRAGVGLGGSDRVTVFAVSGSKVAPSVIDVRGFDRASTLTRRVAVGKDRTVTGISTVSSIPRIESAESITLPSGQRVVVSAWQRIDDIERTVSIVRTRILIAGIGGASIALLLGVWVTTRLTRRIRTLEAGAHQVARGDFTARFPTEGSLELSSLARALDEMQRQLAELETARRRFIATASHELRTPLSTLQGFLELLEDERLDPEMRVQFVAHASQQAQRLGKLASDLLDLSRLDVGAVQVKRAPVDVELLLGDVLGEFRVAASQHDSALSKAIDPRAATALIDADRVRQLLRALVDNALTHTPEGTAIALAATRRGARVEFTVSDDGPGIPTAMQREIFEAFVTSDETRGSGLGLAISGELARRMQGELTVSSSPGSTVFTLSLPA